MISTASPFEKRIKSPLYYLWTKWNQPTHDGKDQDNAIPDTRKHIFGAPLEQVIQYNDHGLSIPITVQLCFAEIVKRGLKTEGLFRLSGATSEVIQLQKAFEGEHPVDLADYDIHSITSFIKKYLHHLPIAVIPEETHDDFLRLATHSKDQAIPMLIDLINSLPNQHSHLFHAILSLASHIQHYAHINMMNPEALAVVLAPVCTGIEKTIQIHPKKTAKKTKKQPTQQYHYRQCITVDIDHFIRTNARWTLLWKWMIEESDALALSTAPEANAAPLTPYHTTGSVLHKDTITSIVGSPAPPPPVPSLLYWSSSLAAAATTSTPKDDIAQHHLSSPTLHSKYNVTPSDYLPSPYLMYPRKSSSSKADLKSRPSSPSMFSLCHKSSHGLLRRLASVSSLR